MDFAATFALIERGLTIVSTLIEAGRDAAPALKAISDLVTGAATGKVDDDLLAKTEALLDKEIADFNDPID